MTLRNGQALGSMWPNHRSLSIKRKVTVAILLVASLFQYPCASIYKQSEVVKEFKHIITNFLWNNRTTKIAYSIFPVAEGGPLHNQVWARKGIGMVQDLCHPHEGRLMSHLGLFPNKGFDQITLEKEVEDVVRGPAIPKISIPKELAITVLPIAELRFYHKYQGRATVLLLTAGTTGHFLE